MRTWFHAILRLALPKDLSWSYLRPFWSLRWTLQSLFIDNAKAISSAGSRPARMAWAVSMRPPMRAGSVVFWPIARAWPMVGMYAWSIGSFGLGSMAMRI